MFLIGEVVEPARGIDCRQQRHVLSEWHPGRTAHRAADVHEPGGRLHDDGDVGLPLSVLDLSPVGSGSSSPQALRNTLDLARLADGLGLPAAALEQR